MERLEFVRRRNMGVTIDKEKEHIVVPLMGRSKGEHGEIGVGPALCHEDCSPYNSIELNWELESMLLQIQEESPELIDPKIDMRAKFSINRSFCRGATTRVNK